MTDASLDMRVRARAFDFIAEQTRIHGDLIPHRVLSVGFTFEDVRVPLIGPQGIFKPAVLPEIPLTIRTAPVVEGKRRPYDDRMDQDGFLEYRYRGRDPNHRENAGLREAMRRHVPLVYLYGVDAGLYEPMAPVYIVGDDPQGLRFMVDIGAAGGRVSDPYIISENEQQAVRAYARIETVRRMHQAGFRHRVLQAYKDQCSICRLRHRELLEAAHILPDGHPKGEPIVANGLALCKLHHAAFDSNILGIRPDLVVNLREDILTEKDGPMLEHGLQAVQGRRIIVPAANHLKPRREFLAERYEMFKTAV